jgi:hypothetical protein
MTVYGHINESVMTQQLYDHMNTRIYRIFNRSIYLSIAFIISMKLRAAAP